MRSAEVSLVRSCSWEFVSRTESSHKYSIFDRLRFKPQAQELLDQQGGIGKLADGGFSGSSTA